MFTTNLKVMFEAFDKIASCSPVEPITEVSIHQNQMSFIFQSSNIVYLDNLTALEEIISPIKVTDITTFENSLVASCRNLEDLKPAKKNNYVKNPLCLFQAVINELANTVCACPALEFVISDTFIKCYIDKPNIVLSDLIKVDSIFDAHGILELNKQRPYVLYVREELNDR